MSQQYPQQPYQPQQPQPQQPYQGGPAPYQPPQEPKKSWAARHKGLTITGGIIGFFIIVGIAAGGGDSDSSTSGKASDTAAVAPEKPAKDADAKPAEKKKPAAAPAKDLSQADQFKAFVAKNGTPAEKAAVKHVTKVQGADKQNDIMDAADIYTDYTGGMMGPNQGKGKLLASAFADWKTSENGLITVYDAQGELLSNGKF